MAYFVEENNGLFSLQTTIFLGTDLECMMQ